jgi:GntR family transcriptional regulator, transcriptional repressor for pyruvate dehydrogenase complex
MASIRSADAGRREELEQVMAEADTRRKSFEPTIVQTRSAADQIAAQLREALVNGVLQPGDRLEPEPELAAKFGVSRATVREAIKMLRTQGMLHTARGAKGGHFVVTPQTRQLAASVGETFGLWFEAGDVSVAEVDEAREVVERACVRFAAERRTTTDLAAMRTILDAQADPTVTLDEYLDLDTQFHSAIAESARNRLLELPMTAIHLVRPRTNLLLRKHDRGAVLGQHRRIFEAIEAGDPEAAEIALLAHVGYLAREREAAVAARHRKAEEIPVRAIAGDDDAGDTTAVESRDAASSAGRPAR